MWYKASTLIESLFAFSLYITVVIMFVSLLTVLNKTSLSLDRIHKTNEIILIEQGDDPLSCIDTVLH